MDPSPIGPRDRPEGHRYFCQVGTEPGNGFQVSPLSFKDAAIDLIDPETWGVFILTDSDYSVSIEDDRIRFEDDGEPVLPKRT